MRQYNHSLGSDGIMLEMSGDELSGITIAVESGYVEVTIEYTEGADGAFVIPPRRTWTTLPGLRLGLQRVVMRTDPRNPTPTAVVSYDVGPNAGLLSLGGTSGEIGFSNATPGDGTWAAAPNSGAEDSIDFGFVPSGFTIYVKTASIEMRPSFDGGNSFLGWTVLEPGIHTFNDWAATNVEIREDVNGGGGQYQVLAVQ